MSHFVYRITAEEGEVLYVGQTNDIERRAAEHRRATRWARHGVVTYEEVPDITQALLRERELILAEQPRHNVKFKGTGPRLSDAVTLSVRVSRETAGLLKKRADANYRPVAAEMRRLIEEHVASEPDEKAAAA